MKGSRELSKYISGGTAVCKVCKFTFGENGKRKRGEARANEGKWWNEQLILPVTAHSSI